MPFSLLSSSSPSSPNATNSAKNALTTAAAVLGTTYAVHCYCRIRRLKRRLGNFPASTPWILPFSLDLVHAIRCGAGLETFINQRKAALKSNNFYLRLPGTQRPTLVVTDPDDQAELLRKEGKLKFVVDMPDTLNDTHGRGSMQNLHGPKHNFYRKVFASLLSPAALDSFAPYFFQAFAPMWADLEEQTSNSSSSSSSSDDESLAQVQICDAICTTQFFLMAKILYGMTPDNAPMDTLLQMRDDFEAQLLGHFAPRNSAAHRKAKEGSQRIHAMLANMFGKVLEERRTLMQQEEEEEEQQQQQQQQQGAQGRGGEEKKDDNQEESQLKIGSAMETIADALIREGVDGDPKVIGETIDNLDLLLEASHGTTKDMTTNTLYYLNHPDNADKLRKLREEAKAFVGRTDAGKETFPTFAQLKNEMPYAEATIKEAMRLAPIISGVTYAVKDDVSFTFKGQPMQGPISFMLSWGQNFVDPNFFPRPKEYMPERWDPDSDMYVSKEAQAAYRPFGAGRHMCLGYQLALLVMKSTLHCFAREETRTIEFDTDKVGTKFGLFPSYSISDGFPAKVTSGKK